MTWDRTLVVPALVEVLEASIGPAVSVFDRPPPTVNPPAVVVGRVNSVEYGVGAFGIDNAELPLVLIGGADDLETVEALKMSVRVAIDGAMSLLGTVQQCYAASERNWRVLNIAGAEVLTVEVILEIRM
jgi:hypothetical protein